MCIRDSLKRPLKRILEQTREKHLPDLILGKWYIECKRYGQGAEPLESWWDQVIKSTPDGSYPALIYKFNHRPIKVRVPIHTVNKNLDKDFNHGWASFFAVMYCTVLTFICFFIIDSPNLSFFIMVGLALLFIILPMASFARSTTLKFLSLFK